MEQLKVGDTFSTPYESGCVVVEEPDGEGNFLATDSDGVICSFSTSMVEYRVTIFYFDRPREYKGSLDYVTTVRAAAIDRDIACSGVERVDGN